MTIDPNNPQAAIASAVPNKEVPADPYKNIQSMVPGEKKNRAFVDQIINESKDKTLQDTQKQYDQYMGQGPAFQLPDQMGMQVVGDALKSKLQGQYKTQVDAATNAVKRNSILDHQKKQGMVLDLANAKLRTEMAREAKEEAARAAKAAKRSAVLGGLLGLAGAGVGAAVGGPVGAQVGMGMGQMAGSQI